MFVNRPVLMALKTPGKWALTRPLTYEAEDGLSYRVPKGFVTDLASIPVLDRSGRSRAPAILHDYLYLMQPFDRATADRLFMEAMLAEGIHPWLAWGIWAGVRTFGHVAWNTHKREMDHNPEAWIARHHFAKGPFHG